MTEEVLAKARQLLRRMLWRLARITGPRARQWAWNDQYASGVWRADDTGRSPATLRLVEAKCQGGKLVEFGCGEGSLPCSLPKDTFDAYVGIDVSSTAIERARVRTTAAGLKACSFHVCDMSEWKGDSGVAVILMEECLYYLSRAQQEVLLERCVQSLGPDGVLVVVVHDGNRHRRTLETCRKVCRVLDEHEDGRTYLTLAPRR